MGLWLYDLLSASCAHTHRGLEGIVNPPLEASKGTNHNHTRAETFCCESAKANLADNRAKALAFVLGLAKLRDKRVGRVGDDSADDTREIARGECDTKLRSLAVGFLRLSKDVGIEELYNLLETEEFGHRVRDLTGPQRNDRAEGEAGLNFCATHFRPGSTEWNGEGTVRASLDFDLGHLQWAERNVSEQFGACGTSEPNGALVLLRGLLTSEIHVVILKELIQAIFEHSLKGISNESGTKAFPDTLGALFGDDGPQAADAALVFLGIYLHVAFGNIEWCDTGVGETTCKNTAKHALGIVRSVVGDWAKMPGIPLARRGEVRHGSEIN